MNSNQSYFDDSTRQWNFPDMLETTDGVVSTVALERRVVEYDSDEEWCSAVEYYLDGRLVHRSARMHMKTGVFAEGVVASLGS